MTTSKRDQPTPAAKNPAGMNAEINRDKTELIDHELKKVTGGSVSKKSVQDDWSNGSNT